MSTSKIKSLEVEVSSARHRKNNITSKQVDNSVVSEGDDLQALIDSGSAPSKQVLQPTQQSALCWNKNAVGCCSALFAVAIVFVLAGGGNSEGMLRSVFTVILLHSFCVICSLRCSFVFSFTVGFTIEYRTTFLVIFCVSFLKDSRPFGAANHHHGARFFLVS
jgi:hypothetical protein